MTIIAAQVGKQLIDFVAANCDAPLFGQSVVVLTDRLGGWVQQPTGDFLRVLDFPGIRSDCDTGHYNLEVRITRLVPP